LGAWLPQAAGVGMTDDEIRQMIKDRGVFVVL
jgi:hypothetical protein